jgi:hypothetical protein
MFIRYRIVPLRIIDWSAPWNVARMSVVVDVSRAHVSMKVLVESSGIILVFFRCEAHCGIVVGSALLIVALVEIIADRYPA